MAEPALKSPRPASNAPEMTVSELSGAIKRALEDGFGYVRLRGRSRAIAVPIHPATPTSA